MTLSTLEKELIATSGNDSIAPSHYQEWLDSSVSQEIIRANVRTLYDQLEVDKLLNRRTKKMWKRPTDLVPCWAVTGVDPLTDMPTSQGVQVKPNTAPLDEKGKPRKYLGAKDSDTTPLFLDTGKEGYWTNILENISTPLFITEGAKKAGALLSHRYAGISIPGVSTCRKRGRLHQNLEMFMKIGRAVYLCFDNDILQKKPVQDALKGLGALLRFHGAVVMVVQLPGGDAKGVDDYIKAFGRDAFQLLVENALTIQEWLDEIKDEPFDEDEITLNSRLATYYQMVRKHWGEQIRYNTLKKRVELNGGELDEDEISLTMANVFDIDISLNHAQVIIRNLSKKDEYSPVCEYLDEISRKFPDVDTSYLDDLAEKYFGASDPIHSVYFKKFLIASVARARQPGCKVDSVFMLMSPEQGKYKSTFFSVLFGEDFFSDQLGTDIGNKDEKMKISQYWCLEWAEFEAIYRRKDVSALKNFITNREDCFRAPYARKDAKHPRPCVFVGTSNEKEILHDPTGDRRFWIVPVIIDKIPLATVRADRDKIWAAADALYKAGYQWWLLDSEELIRAEKNKEYQETSYWDEVIENLWVEMLRPEFLPTEIIAKRLGFETAAQMKPGDNNQLKQSMTRLGFHQNRRRVDGTPKRGWEKPENKSNIISSQNTSTPVTPGTALPDKAFGCPPFVPPPGTFGTDSESNQLSIPSVPLPGTEVEHLQPLLQLDVPGVTGVSGETSNFSQNNKLVSPQSSVECDRTPEDNTVLIDGVEVDRTITANGFYLGQLVQITHHSKRDDWIGKQGRIKAFGNESVRISGDMSAKFGDISPVESDPPKGSRVSVRKYPWLQPGQEYLVDGQGEVISSNSGKSLVVIDATDSYGVHEVELESKHLEIIDIDPKTEPSPIYIPRVERDEDILGSVELLRMAIDEKSWEMITELVEVWTPEYKKAVWAMLTNAEKQAINDLKPILEVSSAAQPTQDYDKSAVPLLVPKGIYWSLSLKSKVEIFATNDQDELKTASCYLLNRNRMLVYPKLIDLRCCEESPRSTLELGDEVVILSGKRAEEFAKIRHIEDGLIYLKSLEGKQSSLTKPYHAHQLAKA